MPDHTTSKPALAPSVDSDELRATVAGTASFAAQFGPSFVADFYRRGVDGLSLSSIGAGTYLGEHTDADDDAYADAVCHAVAAGVNVVDAAINYRAQRSERAVGSAVQRLLASGVVTRQQLVICTKGGYIPLDRVPPATRDAYREYVKREYVDQEILRDEEIVAGGHCLAPRFLRYCMAKSRQNLGLRCVDVYYVHNPEQQLVSVEPAELDLRLRAAFGVLEEAVGRKEIGAYGVATWEGLRVPPGSKSHLSLERLVELARDVAGNSHHFRYVQLPINLAMPEALRSATQPVLSRLMPVVEAAAELGLTVLGSASLMQSKLAAGLPQELRAHFPGCDTDAQRAISFVKGAPGVACALVGMRQKSHVDENLAAFQR